MNYSIKRRKALLWKTGLSKEDIHSKFANRNDANKWLVCPIGESEDAIDVPAFLQSPDYFKHLDEARRAKPLNETRQAQTTTERSAMALTMITWLILVSTTLFGVAWGINSHPSDAGGGWVIIYAFWFGIPLALLFGLLALGFSVAARSRRLILLSIAPWITIFSTLVILMVVFVVIND